jgi:hypothetical protein
LLRFPTSDQKAEGRQELERAKALVRETGAVLLETFINAAQNTSREISTKAS